MPRIPAKQVFCYLLRQPWYKPNKARVVSQATRLGLLDSSHNSALEKAHQQARKEMLEKPKPQKPLYVTYDYSCWVAFTKAIEPVLKRGEDLSLDEFLERWGRPTPEVERGLKAYYASKGNEPLTGRYRA